jgi:hypothetical protein
MGEPGTSANTTGSTDSGAQSTVQIGDRFRDTVASILRTKYADVLTEVRLGNHKKVDIVFSRFDFGRIERIGVECKHYQRPLTKQEISSKIYPDYNVLVSEGELDRVIIVASKDISADARSYVDAIRWMSFRTVYQLEEDLLGLREYIESLSTIFDERELGSYYVEARFEGKKGTAEEYISHWLNDLQANPLAIMGGYGKGKTSFALRIASEQARRYFNDPTERMPVLIRLGHVVHETQLEGLFGKEFTARHPARDFRFRTLEQLNELGRLFIVLDGFDEMKHAMSASDFRANFKEFNRLLRPKSKVLLLGRPNAVPTDARHHVFRGERYHKEHLAQDPTFRRWTEVTIDYFNDIEIQRFLHSYLSHLLRESSDAQREKFISDRVEEIRREVAVDLLARPVHAKIVAELASDPTFDLHGFTRHTLYAAFIKLLVERDVEEKQARRAIGVEDRLEFQRRLAWWSWTKADEGQGFFERDQVPFSLLTDLTDGTSINDETKLAEYLVSTLTEEKEAGILYFAHRSFQEFLVGEKIRTLTPSAEQHLVIAATLSDDILDFLDTAPDQNHIRRWFGTLSQCTGPFPTAYLRYFKTDRTLVRDILRSKISYNVPVTDVAIIGLAPSRVREEKENETLPTESEVIDYLVKIVICGNDDAATMAIICLIRLYVEENAGDAINRLLIGLLRRLAERMILSNEEQGILIHSPQFGAVEQICSKVLSREKAKNIGKRIFIRLKDTLDLAAAHLTQTSMLIARSIDPTHNYPINHEFCQGTRVSSLPELLSITIPIDLIKDQKTKDAITLIMKQPADRFKIDKVSEPRRSGISAPFISGRPPHIK